MLAKKLLALAVAISIAFPCVAQPVTVAPAASANVDAGQGGEMQPKFIWGILLNVAFKLAMSAFSAWASEKLTSDLSRPEIMTRLIGNSATAVVVPLTRYALGLKSAGAPLNVKAGEPSTPLTVENGKENFQGVHVSIVGFDNQGKFTGMRPVTAGFVTGDRIKLKVLPTFEGLLVIENINPRGERKQIFPARSDEAVLLKAGVEVLVPLQANQYFEFAGATGQDQLVITIRDPRSFSAPATAEASRKDDAQGSYFVQEVTPNTYPVISQSLRFAHGV